MTADDIRFRLDELRAADLPTHGGRTMAYVYDSGLAEADELGQQALAMYASTNGLDPTAFPSLLAMERDLVGRAGRLLHGSEVAPVVGTVTSGGTESVLLAVQTARDAHPEIARPVVVAPTTIHAAFHKAAHYFGVELVLVPVDPATKRAVPEAMATVVREQLDRVVLVAASSPSYAHGVIDPISEIGAALGGLERTVRFHVDACIGGWLLPWLTDAPVWDFRVPQVTSISVDLHKYAYTPKGVSLLLHASPDLRRPQFFASAGWPGYTMLNSTMQSTKSGGPLAAAWAVVEHIGDSGYAELAGAARDATLRLADGIAAVDHLALVAEPDTTLVTLRTDDALDVFTLSDLMLDRGWFVQPQMAYGGDPASLHLTVSAATAPHIDEFLGALRDAVAEAVAAGPIVIDEDLRAAALAIDPETLDDQSFDSLLALAGLGTGGGEVTVPQRMAPVNALLDVAPPALREALLVAFLDRLSR